jgi:hypothetical protein
VTITEIRLKAVSQIIAKTTSILVLPSPSNDEKNIANKCDAEGQTNDNCLHSDMLTKKWAEGFELAFENSMIVQLQERRNKIHCLAWM